MPRKPNPNPTSPDQQMRISFLLDLSRYKELDFLKEMTGHGDRPRELIRLAVMGLRAEKENQELTEAAKRAGFGAGPDFQSAHFVRPATPVHAAPLMEEHAPAPAYTQGATESAHPVDYAPVAMAPVPLDPVEPGERKAATSTLRSLLA